MKKYRVFCNVESYSILPSHSKFEIIYGLSNEEIKIRIENIYSEDLVGRVFSKCLSVITELDADNIQDASDKCYAYSESILNKIAFEVGLPVQNLKIVSAFEITKDIEVIEMVNYDYDILSKIGSRAIDLKRLEKIINNSNNTRIDRAMHWYRKALNEKDVLDIFSYLWISLETMSPLFRDIFPYAIEKATCKKCGDERNIEGTAPLKEYFKVCLAREDLYSKARKIRSEIVHGFEDISTIHNKVIEIIDDLGNATRNAILKIVQIEDETLNYKLEFGNSESLIFQTFFKISNFNTDENHTDYFVPTIKVEIDLKYINKELAIIPTITTDIFNHGCILDEYSWDMIGSDPGYQIKKINVKIKG